MPRLRSVPHALCVVTPVLAASLAMAGCVSTTKPSQGRGQIDSPITTKSNHLECLQQASLPVQQVSPTELQIGALPAGPTVVFRPTPGAAQSQQIEGVRSTQGAEVVGQALLYPNQGSDGELKKIETCLAKGVSG